MAFYEFGHRSAGPIPGEELWMHVGDLLVMSLGKELGLVRDICGLTVSYM